MAASDTADLVHALQPVAQGTVGDAASPEAIRRLSKELTSSERGRLATQKKVIEKLKAALAAVRMNDFRLGAKRCLDALALDERSGLAWHVLAICQEKAGDLAQALTAYEAALKLLPDETEVAHDLGRLAQRLGYLEIAEKLLLKYLTANPGHVEATNNLACVLRDAQRYGDAIDALRDMIAIEPASPVLWNTLGTVLSDQGDRATALTFFEESLRIDPAFAKARYNRANVRQPLGDEEGALEDLIAEDRAERVPQHGIGRLDGDHVAQGGDGVAVTLGVAQDAGQVVGRLDVARVGGQIFQQQLFGDLEIAEALGQTAQIMRHLGLVGQQFQRRLIGRQGLGQVAGLLLADGQDVPGQAAALVQRQGVEAAFGP